ncbi:MAG: OmpA family protein [Alphaproteobacteria bacterium]|nr:OmpA family protein [Alphaproteobacteria bacterium]
MQHKSLIFILFLLVSCSITEEHVSFEQREDFVDYANTANSVYFKFDSAKIEDEAVKRVNEMIHSLSIVSNVDVFLYGYTDKVGKIEYNKKLAGRRVNAIKKALEGSGVLDRNNIKIKSVVYGEFDPLVSFDTVDNNPKSRRVDMFIVNRNNK